MTQVRFGGGRGLKPGGRSGGGRPPVPRGGGVVAGGSGDTEARPRLGASDMVFPRAPSSVHACLLVRAADSKAQVGSLAHTFSASCCTLMMGGAFVDGLNICL